MSRVLIHLATYKNISQAADAVVGMEGNGPACADLRDIGLVLSSDNGVPLDGVVATLMGCDPGKL